jgi:hypothetical protein
VEFFFPQDALELRQPKISTHILKKYLASLQNNDIVLRYQFGLKKIKRIR